MSELNPPTHAPKDVEAVCAHSGCDWERDSHDPRALAAMVKFHTQMNPGHVRFHIREVQR